MEAIWTKIYHGLGKPTLIGVIYKPPATNHSEFMRELENVLEHIHTLNIEPVIMGDFNVDIFKKSIQVENYINVFQSYNFEQLISVPTRITDLDRSCIDHIWCDSNNRILQSGSLPGLSDHMIIFCILNKKVEKKWNRPRLVRKYVNFQEEGFLRDLANIPWHNIVLLDNLDNKVELLNKNLLDVLDVYAPMTKVSKRKYRRFSPWIDPELVKLINDKKKILSLALDYGDYVIWNIYKKLKNYITYKIRTNKMNYYKSQFEKSHGSTRETWKNLNELMGKKKKHSDGTKLSKDLTVEGLNNYFVSVGPEIHNNLGLASNHKKYKQRFPHLGEEYTRGFCFEPVLLESVKNKVMEIPNRSAMGEDNLGAQILKLAFPVIGEALTYIYNCSILEGVFPGAWKTTKIIPIYKGGERGIHSSYRPIALLPLLGKVLEKLIHDQLSLFLEVNSLLSNFQCGFKKNNSTATSLLRMTNDWRLQADDKHLTGVLTLDLTKAFDCLIHDIILDRLKVLGLSQKSLNWFLSYLEERYQRVSCDLDTSTYLKSSVGVPQGSVLGPLLFNIYMNPVFEVVRDCKLILFADDITLYISHKDTSCITEKLEMDLEIIFSWLTINGLKLNPSKSQFMIVGTRMNKIKKQAVNTFIKCGDTKINQVNCIKSLGLLIDDLLSWKDQINHVVKKTKGLNKLLLKLRNYMPGCVLEMIFKSLVVPHINYCDVVWMECDRDQINKIQSISNMAARYIVHGPGNSSASIALTSLKWIPMCKLRLFHFYILLWKVLSTDKPKILRSLLLYSDTEQNISTRLSSSRGLKTHSFKTKFAARSFVGCGPQYWNDLPKDVRLCNTLGEFKKEVLKYLCSV